MSVELPSDVAEYVADQAGVYRDPRCPDDLDNAEDHFEDCNCRVYWVPWVTQRMRDAVHAEDKLNA